MGGGVEISNAKYLIEYADKLHTDFTEPSSRHVDGSFINKNKSVIDRHYDHTKKKNMLFITKSKVIKDSFPGSCFYDVGYGDLHIWARDVNEDRAVPAFLNTNFTKISFIPRPIHTHAFFCYYQDYIVDPQYEYKHIAVLMTPGFRRLGVNMDKGRLKKQKHCIDMLKIRLPLIGVPVFELNIHLLLECNEDEYQRLIDFIDEEPLDNWKEIITDYRTAIRY
jgi:hypothetical protein